MKKILKRITRKVRRKIFPKIKLVNFMICGTQKGGTTALDFYLRQHPDVCMGDRKEIHYFDIEHYFRRKSPDYTCYHDLFSPKKPYKLVGEATPEYMYWYNSPRRIWEYNPKAKLIIVLRNPIERAYSQWNMQTAKGQEKLPFFEAIRTEEERRKRALPFQHVEYSYIDRGFYLEQLRRVYFYFSKDQVLVLKSDDLRKETGATMEKVYDFLGIDRFDDIEKREVHKRSYPVKMNSEEREYLFSIYENEIKGLEQALGWDCSDWLSKVPERIKKQVLVGLSLLSVFLPDLIDAVEVCS